MGAFVQLLLYLQPTYESFSEGKEDEEPIILKQPPTPASMAVLSLQPSSSVHSRKCAFQWSTRAANQKESTNPDKMGTTSIESSNDNIDMTMEDNSSSGSELDPDELPAKRLRTSTIVTRSSKATASPRFTPAVTDYGTDIETDAEVAIENASTTNVNEMTSGPAPNAISSLSSPTGVDNDLVRQSSLGTDVPDRTTPLHVLSDAGTEPSPQSPDLHLNVQLTIPEFLTTNSNIYGYLVEVNEPGFKALLNGYIVFEGADHSGHRGNLTTSSRPKGVGWWLARACPNRIPPFDSLSSLGNSIVDWWIFIQPDWWRMGMECGVTSQEGGCWERLYQPGINGLLNVVIVVYWWAKILEERGQSVDASYHWLVADITWVLSQLTEVASEGLSS